MQSTGNEDFGYPEVSLELMPKESSLGGIVKLLRNTFNGSIGWSLEPLHHPLLILHCLSPHYAICPNFVLKVDFTQTHLQSFLVVLHVIH